MVHAMRALRRSMCVGVATMVSFAPLALAVPTVDRTVNITSGNLTSSISMGGTLTVSGSGLSVSLSAGSVLGTPVSVTAPISLPTQVQTITLVPNPTNINNPVTGNFVLRGEDAYTTWGPDPNDQGDYQQIPGQDGLFDDGDSANSAMDLIVASVNAGLINQNIQTNNVTLGASATLSILGLLDVTIPITVNGNVSGNVQAGFNSTGPSNEVAGLQDNSTFPDGAHPYINTSTAGAAPDGVDNLGVSGLFTLPGDIVGALNASLGGQVDVDLGIFGTVSQNLSGLASLNQALNQAFLLLGTLTAQQTPTPSFLHDDLAATIGFDFGSLGLGDIFNLPLNLADSQVFNIDFDLPVDLGIASVTLDGSFGGTINYNLAATATIAPPNYTASGNLSAAVNVPEVNTLVLLGAVGLVGLSSRVWRRRRVA